MNPIQNVTNTSERGGLLNAVMELAAILGLALGWDMTIGWAIGKKAKGADEPVSWLTAERLAGGTFVLGFLLSRQTIFGFRLGARFPAWVRSLLLVLSILAAWTVLMQIGREGGDTMLARLQAWWKRLLGRAEDAA